MSDSGTDMKRLEGEPFEVGVREGTNTKIPPRQPRRENIEIIYSILKACEGGLIETHVLYRANINVAKWKKLYDFLTKGGYIREETKGYSKTYTTEGKGRELTGLLDDLRKLTRYDPQIISNDNIKLRQLPGKTPAQKLVSNEIHSERQEQVFYDPYHDELSTLLQELNQIDSKIIKRALKKLHRYTPASGGFSIQVNPNLSVILKRGKSPSIQILVKSSDSTSHPIAYSSNYSPPEVWNRLLKETKEDSIKALQELENTSRLIISKKYVEAETVAPESLNKPRDTSKQVIPSKPTPRTSYNEQKILSYAEIFLNTKMSCLKHYGKDEVERLLSLFIKEGANVPPHNLDLSYLFNSLKEARILREYRFMGQSCYALRKRPDG